MSLAVDALPKGAESKLRGPWQLLPRPGREE